eukprot:m.452279 g.452279  ORF g.452279 m.452279 type:complete len:465 (+) comp56927_c0_seq2:82-1476(+)
MTRTPSRPQAKRTAAPASAAGKRSSWWPMLALAVALCSAAVVLFADESKALLRSVLAPPRHYKPDFPTHHVLDDIWTRDQVNELLALVKSQGSYLTAAKDLTSKVEHIGEAVPPLPDGKCPNRLLVPNQDHTLCILPSRIDIARHYFTHGGRASLRESFKRLSSRLQVFSGFVFMNLEADVLTPLFRSDKYIKASTDICHGDSIFDPIQLGIIITLPGQTVAAHLDVPWFWGGTRFNIPQWLLIAMEQSKLWSHLRVHQTQGVAYLHEWVNPEEDGGGFFFYPNGTEGDAVVVPPVYNTALVLDGSTIVHGVDLFRPDRHLPDLSPNDPNELRYVGDEKWDLFDGQKVIKTYHTHDLRISLVWRARCFNSTEDRQKWANFKDEIQVEDVLETFQADLRKRGLLGATERPQSFELAMLILKHYVVYPLDVDPSWWIPVNYCQLPLLFQSDTVTRVLTALLSPICG